MLDVGENVTILASVPTDKARAVVSPLQSNKATCLLHRFILATEDLRC